MKIIDRNNISDATSCINTLLANYKNSQTIVEFLAKKIEYANKINPDNWNLNLDLHGHFIRFNIGITYCINIEKDRVLVICLKKFLPEKVKNEKTALSFIGYEKRQSIISKTFFEFPDVLATVPDSIGIFIKDDFEIWLPLLDKSNTSFIEKAINRRELFPQSKTAHSVGAISYLSTMVNRQLLNPSFVLEAMYQNDIQLSKEIKKLSDEKLNELLPKNRQKPKKLSVTSFVYERNHYIIEKSKRLANGICQDCGQSAPFINKKTGEPYLEVHHIIPLSADGIDNIENVVALCPNCHRKRHYG